VLTVAIIQARTGSTRLPGKVLLPLLGQPMLRHVVRRTSRARSLDKVVVATTTLPEDDVIVALCDGDDVPVIRGSADDLLDRYVAAAEATQADTIVRITSDCPLIDPAVIDAAVEVFDQTAVDYASTGLEPRTYPRGMDVEVVRRSALERAWREDADPGWREHATPYIYRHPELFRIARVGTDDGHPDVRLTVDTPEDYELVRRIYDAIGRDDFGWRDVVRLLEQNPTWADLNRHVVQKVVSQGRDPK
jgi:spore coat polysaccharide biosynthesis protein SpsF